MCGQILPLVGDVMTMEEFTSLVQDYSRTTGYKAAYERYQQFQCYKGKKNNVKTAFQEIWRENKRKSQYA